VGERLDFCFRRVLRPPTLRGAPRPTRASKERRLAGKQQRGKIKQTRSRAWNPE
jgi:ribosome-associated protein